MKKLAIYLIVVTCLAGGFSVILILKDYRTEKNISRFDKQIAALNKALELSKSPHTFNDRAAAMAKQAIEPYRDQSPNLKDLTFDFSDEIGNLHAQISLLDAKIFSINEKLETVKSAQTPWWQTILSIILTALLAPTLLELFKPTLSHLGNRIKNYFLKPDKPAQ